MRILFVILLLFLIFAIVYNKKINEMLFKPNKLPKSFYIKDNDVENIKLFVNDTAYISCYHLNKFKGNDTILYLIPLTLCKYFV